ncbi:MAG: 30S ribosomal protein S2 [Rickettsiales bacterium]
MTQSIPKFTIAQMLEAGVHFGHKTSRWNPIMAPFIYGERNGVHIIDLQKTAPLLHNALKKIYEVARGNGKILFVATKKQAVEVLKESALRCGQHFVNKRWLGGMLTNWNTVSKSIKTLEDIEKILEEEEKSEVSKYSKKELLDFDRKRQKLEASLGGIRNMKGRPDLVFVIDSWKENIAIQEAKKLGIPVAAIVDTNGRPLGVDYIIPGNDDAIRSIQFYCDIISDTILKAMENSLAASGVSVDSKKDSGVKVDIKKPEKENAEKVEAKEEITKKEAVAKKEPAKSDVKEDKKEEEETVKKATKSKVAKTSASKSASKAKEEKKPAAKKTAVASKAKTTKSKKES